MKVVAVAHASFVFPFFSDYLVLESFLSSSSMIQRPRLPSTHFPWTVQGLFFFSPSLEPRGRLPPSMNQGPHPVYVPLILSGQRPVFIFLLSLERNPPSWENILSGSSCRCLFPFGTSYLGPHTQTPPPPPPPTHTPPPPPLDGPAPFPWRLDVLNWSPYFFGPGCV